MSSISRQDDNGSPNLPDATAVDPLIKWFEERSESWPDERYMFIPMMPLSTKALEIYRADPCGATTVQQYRRGPFLHRACGIECSDGLDYSRRIFLGVLANPKRRGWRFYGDLDEDQTRGDLDEDQVRDSPNDELPRIYLGQSRTARQRLSREARAGEDSSASASGSVGTAWTGHMFRWQQGDSVESTVLHTDVYEGTATTEFTYTGTNSVVISGVAQSRLDVPAVFWTADSLTCDSVGDVTTVAAEVMSDQVDGHGDTWAEGQRIELGRFRRAGDRSESEWDGRSGT